MSIQPVKPFSILSTFFILIALAGCATTSILADKMLLDFIEDGKTAKEEVVLKLGEPSGTYERERIMTFKIGEDDKDFFVVRSAGTWFDVKYSLVLIFDDNNIIQKHSLVRIR